MSDAFTIRIYVPDGDPEAVRVIDRMNWTGRGVAFPRDVWDRVQRRPELSQPGVYLLVGRDDSDEDDDLPLIYIGQTDDLFSRLTQHVRDKDFWDRGVVFVSTNLGLNRAHITWLEHALVKRAKEVGQCRLENSNHPKEPPLSEFEKADTEGFLREMLQILPLIGITAFDRPRAIRSSKVALPSGSPEDALINDEVDTIIVPAQKDGFADVFIGQNAWWAIRIAGGKLPKIRFVAAYQTKPISAVTHWAPIQSIEPYGDTGKYKLNFASPAQPFERAIPFEGAKSGSMQGVRYVKLEQLRRATSLGELFG